MMCCFCGAMAIVRHHVFFGTANRKISEKHGMVEYLCMDCHSQVHRDKPMNLQLRKKHQREFEEKHGHEVFMDLIKRNYL
jgi:DNA-directed RNA polymerase subunit RPC12/RpoP